MLAKDGRPTRRSHPPLGTRAAWLLACFAMLACASPTPAWQEGVGPQRQAAVTVEQADFESAVVASVHVARYPHPDYMGKPWTDWGQGIVLADGRYISGLGDHLGEDGNGYLYSYDPRDQELVQFADILGVLGQEPGHWGYGKLHSQMVRGYDGGIYFASYRGNRRGIRFDDVYDGDFLFRLDPDSLAVLPLTVPMPRHGIPSLATSNDGRLLYGEAVDPDNKAAFFVYDIAAQAVVSRIHSEDHAVLRSILVGPDGAVYVSSNDDRLLRLEGDELVFHDQRLPEPLLRAATLAASNGVTYGATRGTPIFFAIDSTGAVVTLSEGLAYTASLALNLEETGFYYMPDAHGGAFRRGAPLIEVDGETGAQTTIVELDPIAREHLGMKVGGSYSIAVDEQRRRVFVTVNIGPDEARDGFGEVALFIITLK